MDIVDILKSKYGEPAINELRWKSSVRQSTKDYYRTDPSGAIDMGYATWISVWLQAGSGMDISLVLEESSSLGANLYLDYEDGELGHLYRDEEKSRMQEQF